MVRHDVHRSIGVWMTVEGSDPVRLSGIETERAAINKRSEAEESRWEKQKERLENHLPALLCQEVSHLCVLGSEAGTDGRLGLQQTGWVGGAIDKP